MVVPEEDAQPPRLEKEDTSKTADKKVRQQDKAAAAKLPTAKETRQQDNMAAVKKPKGTAAKEVEQQDLIAAIKTPEQQGTQLQGKHTSLSNSRCRIMKM